MNDNEKDISYVCFQLHCGNGIFSIPIQYVDWVAPLKDKIVPIPHSPDYVAGTYQLPRAIIKIIDLNRLFGLGNALSGDSFGQNNNTIIAVKDTQIGFLVKSGLSATILRPHHNAGISFTRFIHGAYSCDGMDDIILGRDVLNILAFVGADR